MNLKLTRTILILTIIFPLIISILSSLQTPSWIHSTEGMFTYYLTTMIFLLIPILSIVFIFLKRKIGFILAILYGILGLITYGPITIALTKLSFDPATIFGISMFAIFLVLSIITIILSIRLLKKE